MEADESVHVHVIVGLPLNLVDPNQLKNTKVVSQTSTKREEGCL